MLERVIVGKYGVNSYIYICDETKKAFVVDPGDKGEKIFNKVKELGGELEYIILTHAHGDHIGGVEELKKLSGAKIIGLDLEEEMFLNPDLNESRAICGRPVIVEVDYFVHDNEVMKLGKKEIKFISTPGHTKGGMCILVDNHMFTGDTLFNRSIGRTDLYGGNYKEIMNSLFKLAQYPDDTTIYPGHGASSTLGYEKKHNPFY